MQTLQQWYKSQCNGVWEHTYGITIETIDNPGWRVVIDIQDTSLAQKLFVPISVNSNHDDWLQCFVENHQFKGYGDPSKLGTILQHFDEWQVLNSSCK